MSSISNLGGRVSLESAVSFSYVGGRSFPTGYSLTERESVVDCNVLTKTVKMQPFLLNYLKTVSKGSIDWGLNLGLPADVGLHIKIYFSFL